MSDALGWHDATALAAMVRRGEVSAVELVDAAIARIEKLDGEVNAVIHRRFDQARDEARGELPDGPFRGVPFLVKDGVCAAKGDPYHAGTRFLKEAGWIAPEDSELAARYRRAGFVTTVCSERALMSSGKTQQANSSATGNSSQPIAVSTKLT